MSFHFRKNPKVYSVLQDRVLLKFLEEQKEKRSLLVLKDEWRIQFPVLPIDPLYLRYRDGIKVTTTSPLLEYDLTGAIYDELSKNITLNRRVQRRIAVLLFTLFSRKNIFLDPANYYHMKSAHQVLDHQEVAFYDFICNSIEAAKNFIFEGTLYVGALITFALMWNHGVFHRMAHMPVAQ